MFVRGRGPGGRRAGRDRRTAIATGRWRHTLGPPGAGPPPAGGFALRERHTGSAHLAARVLPLWIGAARAAIPAAKTARILTRGGSDSPDDAISLHRLASEGRLHRPTPLPLGDDPLLGCFGSTRRHPIS